MSMFLNKSPINLGQIPDIFGQLSDAFGRKIKILLMSFYGNEKMDKNGIQ